MSTDELVPNQNEPVIAKGLGAWLKQSRERAGMSVEEVARALKLSGSTVQDMERDRTDHIGAPIYYKGFVRAYGKLLDLPSVALENRLSALVDTDPEPQIAQGTTPVRRNRWLERYTWAASYVVGTALLLPLLYWLVSNDGGLPKDLTGTPPAVGTQTEPQGQLAEPPPQSSAVDLPAGSAAAPIPRATTDEESYSSPVTASLTPFGLGRGAMISPSETQDSVQLKLAAPSWVSVVDSTGAQLIYRTLPAGEHRIADGQWPLRVRIGNAARAELFIDGQALTLEPYVRGNVAELALRQGLQGIESAPAQQ